MKTKRPSVNDFKEFDKWARANDVSWSSITRACEIRNVTEVKRLQLLAAFLCERASFLEEHLIKQQSLSHKVYLEAVK